MSDEPGCCLVLNTEDKCVRLRRHLQVKLPNQPIDRRRSVRLVSINLAGQPFARTVLLAHRQHWLNVARGEGSKQQRARLKRHHRHHCLPNEMEISHGRVSWQTLQTHSVMGPACSRILSELASLIGQMLSFATHRSNESGKVILPFLSNPKVTPDEPPCPSVANPA